MRRSQVRNGKNQTEMEMEESTLTHCMHIVYVQLYVGPLKVCFEEA